MIKTATLNKMIDSIHPDDYPNEARFLLKLILIVNRVSRKRIKEVLKKYLAEELIERSDAKRIQIIDALGINVPLRLVRTRPKPQLSDRREPQPEPRQPSKGRRRGLTLVCTFGGCDRKHCSKGLCASHYQQQKLGKPLKPLRARRPADENLVLDALPSISGKLTGDEIAVVNAFSAPEEV